LQAHFIFSKHTKPNQKIKRAYKQARQDTATMDRQSNNDRRSPAGNSTYPKGAVSCSKDSFVVNQTVVFQIKFCGKSPALRVAAERW
jgi:hypothetical protein